MREKLRRSRRDRVIAGVCGGLAEWLGWKAGMLRALFVVGSVIPVLPGAIVYVVLWLLVPADERPTPAEDRVPGSA